MNLILLPLLAALTCSTYGKLTVHPQGNLPGYVQQTDGGGDASYVQQTGDAMNPGYMQQTDNGGDAGYMQQTDDGSDAGYVQQTDDGSDAGYVQQTDNGGDAGYMQQTDDGSDAGYMQQTGDGSDAGYVQQTDDGSDAGYVQQTDNGGEAGYMQQTDDGSDAGYVQQTDNGGDAGYMQQTDDGSDAGYMQQTNDGSDAGYVQKTDDGSDAGYVQQTGDGSDAGYVQQTGDGSDAGYVQQTGDGSDAGYVQQTGDGSDAGYVQQTDDGSDAGYMQQTTDGSDASYVQQTDNGEDAGYIQQTDDGSDVSYMQQTGDGSDAGYLQQTDNGGDAGYMQQTGDGSDAGHMQQTGDGSNAVYMQQADNGGDTMKQTELDALKNKLAEIMKEGDSLGTYKEAARINKIGDQRDELDTDEVAKMNMNGSVQSLDTSQAEAQVTRHLFRYVGVGYNQITGSPDGDFHRGGIDPGIRSTNHIFKFSYRRGSQQPLQVRYQPHHSCALSSVNRAYSGFRSYQSQLSTSVNVKGSYKFYAFTASSTFNQVTASSQSQRRIIVEQKSICNLGHILLKNYGRLLKVSHQFMAAVRRLPIHYRHREYVNFINNWGTHIITEAFVGTKFIKRFTSTYESSYNFLSRGSRSSVGVSFNKLVARGSISFSLSTLNQRVSRGARFGSRLTQFTIGNRRYPLPISMKMMPIFEALRIRYWPRRWYNAWRIGYKLRALYRAFVLYPRIRGRVARDPAIDIPVKWPSGRYSLVAGRPRCPVGFVTGCRFQDNEDRRNRNWFYNHGYVLGGFGRDLYLCYCTRLHRQSSVFKFQKGRYCIARGADSCASLGFADGHLFWDDEDRNNRNRVHGVLPSGYYGRDTGINYCCRGDGDVNTPILLPTSQPFMLYQFGSRGCQRVLGMHAKEVIIRTDDEDSRNRNRCHGARPYDDGCGHRDHRVFMCYYHK